MKSAADAIDLGSTDEDEPPAKRLAIARDGESSSSGGASSSGSGAVSGRLLGIGVLAWNAGGLCPQASMESKLPKIAPLLSSEDIIFVPEASLSTVEKVRKRQLAVLDAYPGYLFRYSRSGKMAVYIKENIATTITVSFPKEPAIIGSVATVRHVDGTWAAVGVYAPNMRVQRSAGSKGVDVAGRLAFDRALFTLLEQLAGVPKVALVGDLNLVWEGTGGGKHGELRERWKAALGQLGFGEPLDRPGADGKVVPTHRSYRDTPPPSRVDFLFVRGSGDVEFGRHDRFWQELAWPADERRAPRISEHTPLWLLM